jgi:hypothetical protein
VEITAELFLSLTRHYVMQAYGGVDVWIHLILISTLDGGEWLDSCLCRYISGLRSPGTHWIGGWVDPRAGLNDTEKLKFLTLLGLELRRLGRPSRSQSLYRLRYRDSLFGGIANSLVSCNVNSYLVVEMENEYHVVHFELNVWCMVLLEKLILGQLLNKLPTLHEIPRFFAVTTRAYHYFQS